MPRVIGVVTSGTGAVIRDILHRLEDRCPTHVVVWPVKVQGEGAAAEIAAAVRGFDALPRREDVTSDVLGTPAGPVNGAGAVPRPDLVIVARGGGSVEDLWAFNEEVVVRAVAGCSIPIISAVGHETDTTLCDHAADLRAPTPTAAAEIAVPVIADLRLTVATYRARTERCARRYVERGRERTAALARVMPRLDQLLAPQRQRADEAAARLARGLERRLVFARRALDRSAGALRPATLRAVVEAADARLRATWRLITSLNPDRVLERGYARVTARTGETLSSAAAARAAGALTLRFGGGATVDVRVDDGRKVERPAAKPYVLGKPDQPTFL